MAAGLYAEHFDMAEVTPVKGGEMGWILETNKAMNRGDGGDGRDDRQEVPGLRARALTARRVHSATSVPDPTPAARPRAARGAEVRPLPVVAEPRAIEPRREVSLPAAVAAATGGFLLGVATFVLVRVLRRPRSGDAPPRPQARKRSEVTASRSFLVDIHLLKDR